MLTQKTMVNQRAENNFDSINSGQNPEHNYNFTGCLFYGIKFLLW
ncbi:MAG: hypothetical protein WDZ69_01850 [Candidatus Pacearchaeota archaeon]